MNRVTLTATSPATKGVEVERRQRILKGKNVLKLDLLQGLADGEFGPETGRACIRAKFWLGYPDKELQPTFGPVLLDLLTGKNELTKAYKARRAKRIKAKAKEPLRAKALARAAHDVGMVEKPKDSNRNAITRRWGMVGPYCAMAVSTWYLDAGSKAFVERRDFAYVPYMLAAAERGEHGLAIVRANVAEPGDIVCFDWDDDGVADHTGLLRTKVGAHETFATREANTSPSNAGSQSNGGGVYDRFRHVSQVATFNRAPAFIRVGR